ncbi:MAG: hypothetical protein ABI162_05515, partial [Luteolibacter sp.]
MVEIGLLSASDWSGAEWIASPVAAGNDGDWADYTVATEFTLQRDAFGVFLRASPDARNGYIYQINVSGDRPMAPDFAKGES